MLQNLFANANDLHDTNIEIFRGNVKYVTYTTQLEAKLFFKYKVILQTVRNVFDTFIWATYVTGYELLEPTVQLSIILHITITL